MAIIIDRDPTRIKVTRADFHDLDKLTERAVRFGMTVTNIGPPVVLEGPDVITRDDYRGAGGNTVNPRAWGMLKKLAVSSEHKVTMGGSIFAPNQPEATFNFPDMPARLFSSWFGGEDLLNNLLLATTIRPSVEWGRDHVGEIPYFTPRMVDDWELVADALVR